MRVSKDCQLESLSRTIDEIDALEAIYGGTDNASDTDFRFVVTSQPELERARAILDNRCKSDDIPELQLLVQTPLTGRDGKETVSSVCLRCCLPAGYPVVPAYATVSSGDLERASREKISMSLNRKANSLAGSEAIMELVEELREISPDYFVRQEQKSSAVSLTLSDDACDEYIYGRRWIWVHHVKDSRRRKSIVSEARDLALVGFLKSGYPGIIVVEGRAASCDRFVAWIKGDKSRPGGFGRNWGHHCRGELNFSPENKRFPNRFEELLDMAELGRLCKEYGLEEEFLEYVMQHKNVNRRQS